MDYELKNIEYQGSAYKVDDSTMAQQTVVVTGIRGQIYDGFVNRDYMTSTFPGTLTVDAVVAKIQADSVSFILNKYPNT